MAEDLNISAGELRASAGAAEGLVTDLQPSLRKAISDLTDASASFQSWTAGRRMEETSDGWGSALETLRDRLSEHAQGMRLLANGRDIMETDVRGSFTGW
ncbi:hypothetical protein ABTZ59_36490 [Streptomyces sp. NPDC094034]|uniref:hypothetical protein n=1 Tax=Streptomyces sp. NPDC094034 TaxID=3155309 RepID=UPI0033321645